MMIVGTVKQRGYHIKKLSEEDKAHFKTWISHIGKNQLKDAKLNLYNKASYYDNPSDFDFKLKCIKNREAELASKKKKTNKGKSPSAKRRKPNRLS